LQITCKLNAIVCIPDCTHDTRKIELLNAAYDQKNSFELIRTGASSIGI